MSAISSSPSLHRLDVVAETGCHHHDAYIGDFGHVDFALSGADGLEQHGILTGRIEAIDDAYGRWA